MSHRVLVRERRLRKYCAKSFEYFVRCGNRGEEMRTPSRIDERRRYHRSDLIIEISQVEEGAIVDVRNKHETAPGNGHSTTAQGSYPILSYGIDLAPARNSGEKTGTV